MKLDQQIAMIGLIRESNAKEAKVWKKQNSNDTAWACAQYAKTCTVVLKSLKKLKRIEENKS